MSEEEVLSNKIFNLDIFDVSEILIEIKNKDQNLYQLIKDLVEDKQ